MSLITKAPKGTKDILPENVFKNHYIERVVSNAAKRFGFGEIRTPVFEHTELFSRSVGDTTDVVQKEMYTFKDKGDRSITLKPEGTAGAARAFIEHGLFNEPLPQKVYYISPCYRYERPQAGRLREFHQFGVECFGSESPAADAEIISLAKTIFDELGLKELHLEINSIGCEKCRPKYQKALVDYFTPHKDELCSDCKQRLDTNPMRLLDCKVDHDREIAAGAPVILDYLCDECKEHFKKVQKYLKALNIEFEINPRIVRGLDYYTKTVFEFISDSIGSQGTICGGGRYDGLLEQLGGKPTPALGFGMGLERLELVMENENCEFKGEDAPDLFIATAGDAAKIKAMEIAKDMRDEGYTCLIDLNDRGLRAQLKYANKLKARYTVVIGDDELKSKKVMLKDMSNGDEKEADLEKFVSSYYDITLNDALDQIKIDGEKTFNEFFGLKKDN